MRMSASISVVFATTLLASAAPVPGDKARIAESAKKVKELRLERIAVLKKMNEQLATLYKHARVPADETLEAAQLLAEAELEIAETDKERVELYTKLIDVLKQGESIAEAQRQAGRGVEASVLKWKAKRLAAEIQLEQAKLKVANAGK